jgi:hypothetical protein
MDLQEVLKSCGIPSGEIRARINSGSMKLNGITITNSRIDLGEISEIIEFGKFISVLFKNNFNLKILEIIGIDNLMSGESNINNKLTDFLKDWIFLRVSSTNAFFIKKGIQSDRGILFDLEGNKKEFKKIEISVFTFDIDKLKKDLEVIDKQLSNPSFIEKAPKFKVQEAINKKERIIRQLNGVK